MFFKSSRALIKDVRAEVQKSAPVKRFAFKVYCCLFIFVLCFYSYVFSFGLSEPLTWAIWAVGVAPVVFFYALWEVNLPAEAELVRDLWPKVWYVRNKQIWPRQK